MPSKQLYIIRIALMTGVFMFAGIVLYQRINGTDTNTFTSGFPLETARSVFWVLVGASALTTLFLRPRVEAAPFARKALPTLIGWSFGEGVALFGTVLHFAGGPQSTLALGLLVFIFALLLLPVPRERA
jgi:hypothetical protein